MAQRKNSKKEIRNFIGEFRNISCEIDRTTSWPDRLDEHSRFLPDMRRPVRRTDSVDDIERYKLYFDLVRKNQGHHFTWKHYCNILVTNLRNSSTPAFLNKHSYIIEKSSGSSSSRTLRQVSVVKKSFEKCTSKKRSFHDIEADIESVSSTGDVRMTPPSKSDAKRSATSVKSDRSNCGITPGSVSSMKKLFENQTTKKRSFLDIEADVESASSLEGVKVHSPSKNVLKKVCTDIRTLAQKTCKSVEKITSTTKYCSACGDVIRTTKVHKKCSKQRSEPKDYKRNITSSLNRSPNSVKSRPMQFQSPTMTPTYVVDPHSKKLRRRKPLFKLH